MKSFLGWGWGGGGVGVGVRAFARSKLMRIHPVFHSSCELIVKHRILELYSIEIRIQHSNLFSICHLFKSE